MAGSMFDSGLYAGLFPAGETRRLFSDSAAIRAMLLVEGALAQVQGQLGVIPQESAAAIHRASLEIQIDPGELTKRTAQDGVPVPALVSAFRREMNAPEHAQYIHWGATSQDIMDTAQMLRLRQVLELFEKDIRHILLGLSELADAHADTPMVARTWGQHATPTSFGAVVAAWGTPLLSGLDDLPALRASTLLVSLSGATGTASALGPTAPAQRAALAASLGLNDPQRSWHTDRAPVLKVCGWMTLCAVALGKMAQDVIAMTQTDCGEINLQGSGASSTMPQKQNPVVPSVIAALALQVSVANGALHSAGMQRFQRDGAAWFSEWISLPQLVLGVASTLGKSGALVASIGPDTRRMQANLDAGMGLIHAEALSFALADTMARPKAQAAVKSLCRKALEEQVTLKELALATYPDLAPGLFDPHAQMGHAPADARVFATRVAGA